MKIKKGLYILEITQLTVRLRRKVIIRAKRDGINKLIKIAVKTLMNNTSFHQYQRETIIISTGISSSSSYLIILL